jgi:allantoin racemase
MIATPDTMRLVLVNPNTSVTVTNDMLALARAEAGAGVEIVGLTARFGASTIIDEAMLAQAAEAVGMMAAEISRHGPDGVIVAAFSNPGASRLREKLTVPVTGLGEAAMREAGCEGRRFAVVTTTPALVRSIERDVDRLGLTERFAGVALTEGDALHLMADLGRMTEALHSACSRAIDRGARAIVIGGGPLAKSAADIRRRVPFPIIEPVSAAVRCTLALL